MLFDIITNSDVYVAPNTKRVLALVPAEEAKPETILHVLLRGAAARVGAPQVISTDLES